MISKKLIFLFAALSMAVMVSAVDTCVVVDMHATCYNLNKTDYTAEVASSTMCNAVEIPNRLRAKLPSMSDSAWFTVTSIRTEAFYGDNCLKSVRIPDSVKHIGASAFSSLEYLHTVSFTDTCSRLTIDENAFSGCYNLRSVTLPVGTDTLRTWAFDQCHSLKTLTIPNTVKYIGNEVWKYCEGLADVYVEWSVAQLSTLIADDMSFHYVKTDTVRLHIPKGTRAAYESTAPWKYFYIVMETAALLTPPTAVDGLVYNGTPQALLNNDGVAEGGTLNYSLDNSTWSEAIPTATAAGNYTVYYMVVGDANHDDFTPDDNTIAVTIAPKDASVAVDNKVKYVGQQDPQFTATVTGLCGSDNISLDYTRETGENAGVYQINATCNPQPTNYHITAITPGTLEIMNWSPASLVTPPTAKSGLVYTGTAQALLNNDGVAEGGTLNYSLDNSTWSEAIPSAIPAGNYTVYYMVVGDATHSDYTPLDNTIAVSIAKAPLTIKADDTNLTYGDPAWWCNHATYTGFVNGEDVTVLSGAVQFANEYSTGSNVGVYTITPYGVTAANYDITFVPGTVTVDKADVSFTAPTAIAGLEYNGAAQTLINAGSAIGGEMQYKLDDGAYTTALPQATDAGDYTVWYRVVGDKNHNDVAPASIVVTIAAPSVLVITANPDPDHPDDYYSTFYYSVGAYELPAGTEAYVAELSTDALLLTRIAQGGQVLPESTAVIFKANSNTIILTPSNDTPVSFTAANSLQGVDEQTAPPANCYVLSGHSSDYSVIGLGFYQYTIPLKPHKAYVVIDAGGAQAPKRLRFVFNTANIATGVENVANDRVQTAKVIENGVLYIIRDGVRYNAQGQMVHGK